MQLRKMVPLLAFLGLCLVVQALPSGAQATRQRSRVLVIIGDQGISKSYVVNGRSVSVGGTGHRITLKGRCPSLRVTGTNNHVYVDAVRSISLSGRNNRVYWRRLYNGRKPRVNRTGTSNYVLRRPARRA